MTNILEAITNIVNHNNYEIKALYSGRNRANSMGEALENYIKDAFANTFDVKNERERLKRYNENFSWLGNQNNPPDAMLRGGDAIEVKKTQSPNVALALNSSYPKSSIKSSSTLITNAFRECEDWSERDIIYSVGHTNDTTLKSLWLFYGNIYAAKHEIYERIKNTISEGINSIKDVEFTETKELGGVRRIDPLGITNLRIRGMWHIQNPRKVFDYIHKATGAEFELVCIIPTEKYNSFNNLSIKKIEAIQKDGFKIEDIEVKNPNNPANLILCKKIAFITTHSTS